MCGSCADGVPRHGLGLSLAHFEGARRARNARAIRPPNASETQRCAPNAAPATRLQRAQKRRGGARARARAPERSQRKFQKVSRARVARFLIAAQYQRGHFLARRGLGPFFGPSRKARAARARAPRAPRVPRANNLIDRLINLLSPMTCDNFPDIQ